MIHNKQYIIYNLQEMCFIKKEARGPTRPGSFVYSFGPNLRVWSGLSGRHKQAADCPTGVKLIDVEEQES